MNPDFSIKSIMYANKVESRLKFNTVDYVTESSRKIIVSVIKGFSSPVIPINDIGTFMTLLSNGHYQNIAISTLICHLFYLRIFRYNFRLIKKSRHKFKDLIMLMLVGGQLTEDLFYNAVKAFLTDHKQFMDIMFEVKARATIAEQFDLQQIQWRYWKNHHARRNDHRVYRFWW